jgi:uncharacterized protein YbdZ (MbtH family)
MTKEESLHAIQKGKKMLQGAHLQGADLRWADLRWADLRWADLRGADLRGADLRGADLRWADLRWADLQGAHLQGAHLQRSQVPQTVITPNGALKVWKKCETSRGNPVIVYLAIPEDALRSNAATRKCRSNTCIPLEIEGGHEEAFSLTNSYPKITYRVGQKVYCHEWDPDWKVECGGGIHWFLTREEAENFRL